MNLRFVKQFVRIYLGPILERPSAPGGDDEVRSTLDDEFAQQLEDEFDASMDFLIE